MATGPSWTGPRARVFMQVVKSKYFEIPPHPHQTAGGGPRRAPGDQWMKMKNAEENGKVLWMCDKWNMSSNEVQVVKFPKEMLKYSVLGREMCFYSKNAISDFKIMQRMKLHGQVVEDMCFNFGFVIPGSTNTWD